MWELAQISDYRVGYGGNRTTGTKTGSCFGRYMTGDADEELRAAVESFVDDVDLALHEYEEGYVDADATLSVVQSHLVELRGTLEATDEG